MKALNQHFQHSGKVKDRGFMTNSVLRSMVMFLLILTVNSCGEQCEIGCGEIEDQLNLAGKLLTDSQVMNEPEYVLQDSVEIDTVANSLGELVYTEQQMTAYQVRQLSRTLLSDGATGVIYPGAIIQGGKFEAGSFVPVTIPKTGGTLTITGLSGSSDVTEEVEAYQFSDVQSGIARLLNRVSGEVKGTQANFLLKIEEVNSSREMKFHMGLDARYKLAELESSVNITNREESGSVMLTFTQIFYSISIDQPETMFSMFRDGINASDPEAQISEGNPPLYVSSVHYGRQILFMVETEHSTEDVKVSLNAAYNGILGSTKLESGFSYKEVLDNSTITYIVKGGSAGIALQEMASYEEVMNVISEGAEWSPENPGSPIAFDLRYLTNREFARMAFADEFARKSCILIPAPKQPDCYNACVTFRNSGGYVARVKISYIDCSGNSVSHSKNNLTAGFNFTREITTRTGEYTVEAWTHTGIAWEPYNLIMRVKGKGNKCYNLRGTTLHPSYNNNCKVCP